MFEKVNPKHPDKIADRIAGAIVDLAYAKDENPRIAVEVLVGHGHCYIIAETSVHLFKPDVEEIVYRIIHYPFHVTYKEYRQDRILAKNQKDKIRCGDNGIFRGVPVTDEQRTLSRIAQKIFDRYPTDGKYILDGDRLIIKWH